MDVPAGRIAEVRAAAARGTEDLRACWAVLVDDLGQQGASRVWQEAFAALDAEQQT